ncbi:MAG: PAS domain S-box protein [Pseudohongiella sp.]|nr:PAS domain S-box protein [Pseudohongiella sp.]
MANTTIPHDDDKKLERLNRQHEALYLVARDWRYYQTDVSRAVHKITETVTRALAIERVSVWYYDAQQRSLLCGDLFEATPERHSGGSELSAAHYPAYFSAMETEEVILAADAMADLRTCEFTDSYLRPHNIFSMLDVPIHAGGKLAGVLCCEHVGELRKFCNDEINTVSLLANLVGAAIEHKERQEKRKRIEELLRNELAIWNILFEQSIDGIVVLEQDGSVYNINNRFVEMLGCTREEARQMKVWDWYVDFKENEIVPKLLAVDESGDRFETVQRRKDGTLIDVEISVNSTEYNGKKLIFSIIKDITERKRIQIELLESEARYRNILETVQDIIFTLDQDGAISSLNPSFERITGWSPEEWLGKNFLPIVYEGDRELILGIFQKMLSGVPITAFDLRILTRSGAYMSFEANAVANKNDDSVTIVGVLRDITDRKRAEEKIHHLAITDGLTGIANRREFTRLLEGELDRVRRYGAPLSLLMYDLDHFKRVNDTFGHDTGDYVLQTVVQVVNENLRKVDIHGRWGGEEFMVLLPQTDIGSASDVAQKLRQAIELHTFGKAGQVTASFGLTQIQAEDDVVSLTKRVDEALYLAKQRGRNRVEILQS